MNVPITCPYCKAQTVIEIDGNCEECNSPLGFPAISKEQEIEVLGKIYTVDRPDQVVENLKPKKVKMG